MRIWDMDNDPNTGLYRSRSLDSLHNAMNNAGQTNGQFIDQSPYATTESIPINSFQKQQPYPWLGPTGMMPNGLSGMQPPPFGQPTQYIPPFGQPTQYIPPSSQSIPIIPPSFQQPIRPRTPQQPYTLGVSQPINPQTFPVQMKPGLQTRGLLGDMPGIPQAPYNQFLPDPPEPLPSILGAPMPLPFMLPGENIFTRESAKLIKRNRNIVIGITIASILLAGAIAGVIVLIVGFNAIPEAPPITTTIGFTITRTDLAFGDELNNPMSYNHAIMSQTFCAMISDSYLRGAFAVNDCSVNKLESGSVRASMIITVINLAANSENVFGQVASTIIAKSDADPNVMAVDPSSIKRIAVGDATNTGQ